MDTNRSKKALISVANKDGIVPLAQTLKQLSFEIIATSGTQRLLKENDIDCINIADYTGGTESERVKTLSQRIATEILETGEINLVVCNLYPFYEQKNKSMDEMIEFIDIGGVTLIRAGAKNYKKVGVVFDPIHYAEVMDALNSGHYDEEFRLKCARRAFDYIAWYDAVIAEYFLQGKTERDYFTVGAEKFMPMRYGENPHQRAAYYLNRLLQEQFIIHSGKQISYNNLLDAEVAFGAALEFSDDIACAVIKHQTPCGVAIGSTQVEAFARAYEADSLSAFGGIVGLNQSVDGSTAEQIKKHFFEVVIAPAYHQEALDILSTKKNLRIVQAHPDLLQSVLFRPVFGGVLIQDRDTGDFEKWEVVTKRPPDGQEVTALKFAWKVVKWTKSNSCVFATENQTTGIGAGQTSRVGAVKIAAGQTGKRDDLFVMASDAFFPFRDGVDVAAKAGVTAIVQPGGSKRDQEVIDACDEQNIAMVFTGMRHFRH
jgi:phosphoribosylaminoimidazolecarboxamide formyltransferase/IMP cyclohydrolase